ncbi:MAG TPA: cytochrome ubiquinol oxidase subunit I [Steroidobacteraceae bacterium]|nr:cytochrome ubiquinol oxidase subunit I [Steroidobacteraceae bacterium]
MADDPSASFACCTAAGSRPPDAWITLRGEMDPDSTALFLARLQFAFTVSFHIIFPAISIGLASYLAVLEGLWLYTRRTVFLDLFNYWKKLFAVAFGMGVVSGIVMSYQFGTNWSVFSDKAGPVIGPLMGYEVLTAFFLEAGFLGVMLFGLKRVGPRLHFLATCMVALGTALSAFWILSVNSWMQTPQGYAVNAAGQFIPTDWWAVVFNPSFPYRLVHMVLAAYLSTAFIVGGTAAWQLLHRPTGEATRIMLSMAMWMAALVAPLQVVVGDLHGLNTFEHQPAKVAAMEGHFDTRAGAPLVLFGWPDMEQERTRYAVEVPKLGSLILTHAWDGTVRGLKEWPAEERPNATVVFWSFRVMVAVGVAMFLIGLWSLWLRTRRTMYEQRVFLRAVAALGPSGLVAVIAGWITTEVGRQPYTIYGVLRTADSVSPVATEAVAASLVAFVVVYFAVFGAGAFYMLRLMREPPKPAEPELPAHEPMRAQGIMPGPVLASPLPHAAGEVGRRPGEGQ